MSTVTRAAPHLSVEEVREKLRLCSSDWLRQRWLVIYTSLVAPRRSEEIAAQLGVSKPFVSKITSLYKRFGPEGIETVGPGGRRNCYLSLEEERTFLAPFIERAETGEFVTIDEIYRAFETRVEACVDPSTIYRLLERHEWRKVVPRGQHPKADEVEQDAFKKTSKSR